MVNVDNLNASPGSGLNAKVPHHDPFEFPSVFLEQRCDAYVFCLCLKHTWPDAAFSEFINRTEA